MSLDNFDHPCKQTCSGWQQGYEKGLAAEKAKSERLLEALKHFVGLEIWDSFTAETFDFSEHSKVASDAIAEYNTPELPVSDLEER